MRQHKILTRTLLILSIINFALAAPVAVRERPEVRLDANGTRNVTAASQKRWDPLDEGGSTNVPGPDHAPPPNLDSTDSSIWQLSPLHSPDSLGSLKGWHYVPPSPGSLSPPPPESGSTNLPLPDHPPPPSLDSTSWEELTRMFGIAGQHRYTGSPPHSPNSPELLTGPDHVPPSPGPPTGSRLPVGSMPVAKIGRS